MAVNPAKEVSGIVWAFEQQVEEKKAQIMTCLLCLNSKWASMSMPKRARRIQRGDESS